MSQFLHHLHLDLLIPVKFNLCCSRFLWFGSVYWITDVLCLHGKTRVDECLDKSSVSCRVPFSLSDPESSWETMVGIICYDCYDPKQDTSRLFGQL